MFLVKKYTRRNVKSSPVDSPIQKVTDQELNQLNHKIDKLLTKLDKKDVEPASDRDDECVICVNAKATMQTLPCGHRVVCRKCFLKTIQMAVTQRTLPLRCVICRTKILQLNYAEVPLAANSSMKTADHTYKIATSASLYSVSSGDSSGSNSSKTSRTSGKSKASMDSSPPSCNTKFASSGGKRKSKIQATGVSTRGESTCYLTAGFAAVADAKTSFKKDRVVPEKGKFSLIKEFRREFNLCKETSNNRTDPPQKPVVRLYSKEAPMGNNRNTSS